MKLKSYLMEQNEITKPRCIPKGGFGLPKVKQKKYQTKIKGYSEECDFLYYNNFTDERELAEVTNFRYTQDSSDDSSY